MNAFIIGNGFDIAHNLPTSYRDFRDYLLQLFPEINGNYLFVPTLVIGPHGEELVSEEDAVSLLFYLLNNVCGDDWSDFENSLGKIDLLECFDDLVEVYDKDGDRNLWHEAYNNEDRTSDLSCVIPMIKVLFSEWVESIEPAKKKLYGFSKLIDSENDLFITFNYTHTLEELYGCKKVIHMHGEVGQDIIVGHNGIQDYTEENLSVPIGCYDSLQSIYDGLRKNVDEIIDNHYKELQEILNCDGIYSFGFSYSNVDLPYIKTICDLITNKNIIWYNNDYDKNKIPYFEDLIRKCGFNGCLSTYMV